MRVLDTSLVIASLLAGIWWMVARRRGSGALDFLSVTALGLAAITLAFEGRPWQLVPWQIIALVVAAVAGLRRWRPEASHRWTRVPGRIVLLVGILAGGFGLLAARVPSLPEPSGPLQVGSVVYRWTDPQRPEIFTAETEDRRQVVAQAWYPSARTEEPPVPYFEAQGRLPPLIDALPWFFFDGFGAVNTHARTSPAVAAERATWPVLLFLPGWGTPREQYTALCTDLASRGDVVVALSHPYESAVSLLDDGRVVGQAAQASMLGTSMAQVAEIRAADSSFVLDQLSRLTQREPRSPLAGHLDLEHVGIAGHSLGGATAAQVIANDSRFQVGVNIDGTLHDTLATARLDRPFLWLQSDGAQQEHYLQVRDGWRRPGRRRWEQSRQLYRRLDLLVARRTPLAGRRRAPGGCRYIHSGRSHRWLCGTTSGWIERREFRTGPRSPSLYQPRASRCLRRGRAGWLAGLGVV